jgi:hypothetical protein
MAANNIPVELEYKDKGLAAVTARLNAVSGLIERKLSGLRKLHAAAERLQKSIEPIMRYARGAAIAIGAMFVAAGGLGAGVKGALDLGGALSDLNTRTGIAVDSLLVMQEAFKNNGLQAGDVGNAVNRLQKALEGLNEEGQPTNETFEQLGLNMDELKKLSPEQQFAAIGKAINGLESASARSAAAMAIFGKSGGEMLTLFADTGAMGNAAKEVGAQAKILKDNAALFDNISDFIGNAIPAKLQGFFVGMAEQVAPILAPLVEFFRGTDFTEVGRKFGAVLAFIIQSLTDGSLWQIIADSAIVAATNVLNFLWRTLSGILSAAVAYVGESIKNAVTLFQVVTKPGFWAGIGFALMSIAARFNAMMMDGVADLLDALRNVPGIGKAIGRAADWARGQAVSNQQTADFAGSQGVDLLTPAFDAFKQRVIEMGAAVVEAFAKGRDAAGDLVDNSGIDAAMSARIAGVIDNVHKLQALALGKGAGDKKGGQEIDFTKRGSERQPSAERLLSLPGFGLFVKDPLLTEARKQTQIAQKNAKTLETIAKNTAPRSPLAAGLDALRFA